MMMMMMSQSKEFEFIRALTVRSDVWISFCPNFDFTVKAPMSLKRGVQKCNKVSPKKLPYMSPSMSGLGLV